MAIVIWFITAPTKDKNSTGKNNGFFNSFGDFLQGHDGK